MAIETPPTPEAPRRPLKARGARAPRALAGALARRGVAPNTISIAGIVFAALGAAALVAARELPALAVAAALFIQLRLLCNLIDGLVAVEGGLGKPDGELFNEVPDRVSDTLLLAAAGYAAGIPELGWGAALAAAVTAYVRVLGGSLGLAQDFAGPMAKQQRMAVLTLAAVVAPIDLETVLTVALALITAGSALTAARRLLRVRRLLLAR